MITIIIFVMMTLTNIMMTLTNVMTILTRTLMPSLLPQTATHQAKAWAKGNCHRKLSNIKYISKYENQNNNLIKYDQSQGQWPRWLSPKVIKNHKIWSNPARIFITKIVILTMMMCQGDHIDWSSLKINNLWMTIIVKCMILMIFFNKDSWQLWSFDVACSPLSSPEQTPCANLQIRCEQNKIREV